MRVVVVRFKQQEQQETMSIRPSMWSAFFVELSPEDMIDHFMWAGYDCTELSDEHSAMLLERGNPTIVGREYKSFLDGKGFSTPQGHLFLKCDITLGSAEGKAEIRDTFSRWFELYDALDIKTAVLHVAPRSPEGRAGLDYGKGPVWDSTVENLGMLLELSRGASFTICLENLINEYYAFEQLALLMDTVPGGERLGFCLDTGHLALKDGNCAEYVRKAGARLKALHVTDCIRCPKGGKHDHYFPAVGCINWKETVAALREVGYEGLFNFEVPHERQPDFDIALLKLDYSYKLAQLLLR